MKKLGSGSKRSIEQGTKETLRREQGTEGSRKKNK